LSGPVPASGSYFFVFKIILAVVNDRYPFAEQSEELKEAIFNDAKNHFKK
jgi:hypothetical protein